MAFFEIIFYSINLGIGVITLVTADVGGSIMIHTFGAYFGLACSYFATTKAAFHHPAEGVSY